MKKVKSLISLNQSMLNYLFFAVKILFNLENTKKILKDTYIASSSMLCPILEAMVSNLQNGLTEPLLLKMYLQKKKRIK